MRIFRIAHALACLLRALPVAGQSPFPEDRIDLTRTTFVLHEQPANFALYGWASQWTASTVALYEKKTVIFKWDFADGTVAYSQNGGTLGGFAALGYAGSNGSTNLE